MASIVEAGRLIDALGSGRFEWGSRDCLTVAAELHRYFTGKKPAKTKEMKRAWKLSYEEAMKDATRQGGIGKTWMKALESNGWKRTEKREPGNIVIAESWREKGSPGIYCLIGFVGPDYAVYCFDGITGWLRPFHGEMTKDGEYICQAQ